MYVGHRAMRVVCTWDIARGTSGNARGLYVGHRGQRTPMSLSPILTKTNQRINLVEHCSQNKVVYLPSRTKNDCALLCSDAKLTLSAKVLALTRTLNFMGVT